MTVRTTDLTGLLSPPLPTSLLIDAPRLGDDKRYEDEGGEGTDDMGGGGLGDEGGGRRKKERGKRRKGCF